MAMQLQWTGRNEAERIAKIRQLCYGAADNQTQKFLDSVTNDHRQHDGDFLIASEDQTDVGTATSLSLRINLRGAVLPCQGVAWVGTSKTHRRGQRMKSDAADEPGVATRVMRKIMEKGKERGQFVSALMPFRASFYEHFGYGNAERRCEWTIPMSILPRGAFDDIRFARPADDFASIIALRNRDFEKGHGDVASDEASIRYWIDHTWSGGMTVVEARGDVVHSYASFTEERTSSVAIPSTQAAVVCDDFSCDSEMAFTRLLHFFASLKDQYSYLRITTPADWPVNAMLKETQIPHRQVDHAVSAARPFTRMQIRILDHARTLAEMILPGSGSGSVVVYVVECEGTTSRLKLNFEINRVTCDPTTDDADVILSDSRWASIVAGELRATDAAKWGFFEVNTPSKLTLLDAFFGGPLPWCQEYF